MQARSDGVSSPLLLHPPSPFTETIAGLGRTHGRVELTVLVREESEFFFKVRAVKTEVPGACGAAWVDAAMLAWFDHRGGGRKETGDGGDSRIDKGEKAARAISWQTALSFAL